MKTVTTLSTSPNPLLRSFSHTLPDFVLHRQNSQSFHRNFTLFSSRRRTSLQKDYWCGNIGQTACLPSCVPESRLCKGDISQKTIQLANDLYKFGDLNLHTTNQKTIDESKATRYISASVMDTSAQGTSIQHLLKFVFLFGSLTVLGASKANAASDFVNSLQSANFLGDLDDISTGFASAFLLIFFSELGDKTFFIAALLAARNSPTVVFTGTFGALAIMTIISVILGRTFHYIDGILPFSFGGTDLPIDDIAAVGLLVYFGITTLLDATSSDSQKAEDEQKEAELAVSDFSGNGAGILAAASTVISTFALVFVAEWGDKSFFSTIALAAASSPLGVVGGALAGHGVATLLAVAGGSLLGTFLSEKVIAYTGGILFLIFAGVTVVEIIQG